MTQPEEKRVRQTLEPYHLQLLDAVLRGYQEWREIRRFKIENGFGTALYPRTDANEIFDAVVRNAMALFADDPEVRIVQEPQTVKFCFSGQVLLRFKKGDEANLGRNLKTQAVLDFVSAQGTLPGLPPEAAKVEVLYSSSELGDAIESVLVVARDGDQLLWHYELSDIVDESSVVPLLRSAPDRFTDDEPLVKPRNPDQDTGRGKKD
ncbi:hypothetical protein SAMN05421688_3303 [Poseidonocella pacifica]|uniref:Uncharacterized protein n=1 Tax=Poseidonocella pacifica TaxID=871651 RepID=A0A1I0YSX1_9RHOB|nr:hypothetical protein [Poseidonocella pacifica]SFB15916.1 hypothetical protein SAMN05421688_3303 [Poseidonocella pacifica]